MSGYHHKALHREDLNIKAFAKKYGIGRGNTFLLTLTFIENITDKKEAAMYWNIIRTQITKIFPLFRYICVWERQNRGAWHLHILCNIPTVPSMNKFREFLKDVIKRSNTPFGFIHVIWTRGNAKSLGNYLFKYLTKESREKCIRYVNYSRNFLRCCSSQFMFAGGQAGKWRACCRVLDDMFPETFRFFYRNADFDSILRAVNGVNGDTKSFFTGLQAMFLYFTKVRYSSYYYDFSMQFYDYVSSFRNRLLSMYPYGQLNLGLKYV